MPCRVYLLSHVASKNKNSSLRTKNHLKKQKQKQRQKSFKASNTNLDHIARDIYTVLAVNCGHHNVENITAKSLSV